jgi:hypothetical protein
MKLCVEVLLMLVSPLAVLAVLVAPQTTRRVYDRVDDWTAQR